MEQERGGDKGGEGKWRRGWLGPRKSGARALHTHGVLLNRGVQADDRVIVLLHARKELVHLQRGRKQQQAEGGWGGAVG